jgi:hypothetical protein
VRNAGSEKNVAACRGVPRHCNAALVGNHHGIGGTLVKALAFLTVVCLLPARAAAQVEQVTTPPPNLILSNYNSVPVGPYGGLEGSAYVARVDDPAAAWFNPAGLARQSSAQVSGSAGVYQFTTVTPRALPNRGGSLQQLPNFVGFTFSPRTGLTAGFSLVTTNSWNQETDSELIAPAPAGQQRFAYSADSTFEQRVAAISAGYHGGGPWRFGGGFAFSLMNIRLVQSASDRLTGGSELQSLLLAARASGSAFQLRGQAGAQYDLGRWRFGGPSTRRRQRFIVRVRFCSTACSMPVPARWVRHSSTSMPTSNFTCRGNCRAVPPT